MSTHQLLHRLLNPPPPQPPLDVLMDVETYNIGVEGIGEGNKITPFTSHVQHYHSSQSIAQQALVSL